SRASRSTPSTIGRCSKCPTSRAPPTTRSASGARRPNSSGGSTMDEIQTTPAEEPVNETRVRAAPPVGDERGVTRSQRRALERGAAAAAERERTIADMGQQYAKWVTAGEVAAAIRGGEEVDEFRERILRNMESRHTDTSMPVDKHFAREVNEKYS